MTLDELDTMTAEEVRAVDLYLLLHDERQWLTRCALATLANTAYASGLEPEDVASELMTCISRPGELMDRQAEKPPATRARSLRAYLMQVINTQWRRVYHTRYATVGHVDIDDVETVITHDEPDRLRSFGVSVEQEHILRWEADEADRRTTMQLESLRDAFPAQQFRVLHMSIVQNLGPTETASMLNCSTNNVHGLLRKARRRLQEIHDANVALPNDE